MGHQTIRMYMNHVYVDIHLHTCMCIQLCKYLSVYTILHVCIYNYLKACTFTYTYIVWEKSQPSQYPT